MKLNEIKAIITGGSTGIGYEIAKQLKDNGAQVFICARNDADIAKAVNQLKINGTTADVSIENDVDNLFEEALRAMGEINVVINNAGVAYFAPLVDTSLHNFREVWEVNVKGAYMVGKRAANYFIENNIDGNIINVASTAASKGFATGTAYCASKFALAGMTQCWQAELRKYNIRVMQVNPSEVITPLIEKLGNTPTNNIDTKLKPNEIAHSVTAMLQMNDVGFVPELTIWATNPK